MDSLTLEARKLPGAGHAAGPRGPHRNRRDGALGFRSFAALMGIGVACLATIVLLHGWTLQTARTVLQVDVDIAGGAWAMADLLLALLLVVSGFGLLRRRSWARWLTVGVAALQVVSTLAMVVLLWTHMPEMTGVDERTRASAQAGLVAGTLLRLLGIVYPLVALCVLARRSTAEAFRKDRATP